MPIRCELKQLKHDIKEEGVDIGTIYVIVIISIISLSLLIFLMYCGYDLDTAKRIVFAALCLFLVVMSTIWYKQIRKKCKVRKENPK